MGNIMFMSTSIETVIVCSQSIAPTTTYSHTFLHTLRDALCSSCYWNSGMFSGYFET